MSYSPTMTSTSVTKPTTQATSMLYPRTCPPISTVKGCYIHVPQLPSLLSKITQDTTLHSLLERAFLTTVLQAHLMDHFPSARLERRVSPQDIQLLLGDADQGVSTVPFHDAFMMLDYILEDTLPGLLPDIGGDCEGLITLRVEHLGRLPYHYKVEAFYQWLPVM